jgi:hypothetical protein
MINQNPADLMGGSIQAIKIEIRQSALKLTLAHLKRAKKTESQPDPQDYLHLFNSVVLTRDETPREKRLNWRHQVPTYSRTF